MARHILIVIARPAREQCPRCVSRLPRAGAVVEDSAGVRAFVCDAHLAELSQVCRLELTETQEPVPAADGGAFIPPPPPGSDQELAETALAVGWPGAFGPDARSVEELIRRRLLWRSE